ncbi:MAG: nucleotidyltransferase [Myxococcaceae bacterium]|nr:nucleotidyltransferase [Myxococcaceae bacterium]
MKEEKRHPNHPGEIGTDKALAEKLRDRTEISARARAIDVLQEAGVPFVVGGAYAYCNYTGIYRDTKDLDLFPKKEDAARALDILAADGWETERRDEVWLYKAYKGEYFVDLIFSSGNGVATVDDEWFEYATVGEAFGRKVLIAPAEEMIWSKAFICERERFDGGDVNHLIRAVGDKMDWQRLMRRFDRYWEVLFAHLILYRFSYPSDRTNIPEWVMAEMMRRTLATMKEGDWGDPICRGPLISRVNYDVDMQCWGYLNGRIWDEHERQARDERATGSGIQHSSGGRR